MTPLITPHGHWLGKQSRVEVVVTRITFREVSYIALCKSFSGTLPQWQFLQGFQAVTEHKKKPC